MAIPKIIHQTAKTRAIPERWKQFQARVVSLHPGWEYRLWTDEDNLTFVGEAYPDFLETFKKLPKNIMRADVIRYLIMHRIGGLYLDLDYEMLRPFDLTDYPVVLPLEYSEKPVADGPIVCNSIFAAAPGHRLFEAAIRELGSNPPLGPAVDVIDATGPRFLSRMLRSIRGECTDVFTPRVELFSPITPRNRREYNRIVRSGVAYGIHHCDGSWREYGLLQGVNVKVKKLIRRLI